MIRRLGGREWTELVADEGCVSVDFQSLVIRMFSCWYREVTCILIGNVMA